MANNEQSPGGEMTLPAQAEPSETAPDWVFTLPHTHRRLWDARFQLLDALPLSPRPQNVSV